MKLLFVVVCLLPPSRVLADDALFDLAGPKIDIRVTRGTTTLPIAEVPNLQTADKIWLKADLPEHQENRLILVVAFLRGTTDEPPDSWFTRIETWGPRAAEGSTITVPDGAQQALLFLAPSTGGNFDTLRSAVRGRPGIFIRANAQLNKASFEQQRIERYLAGMRAVAQLDPDKIQDRSAKLAKVLALAPNAECFKKPAEEQVDCLTQSKEALLLDDGHGAGIAAGLSTGASSDFINEASTAPVLAGGNYSTYVGTLIDLVHLVSLLHTAQFQYIPAISFPQGSTLNLRLNAAPSFNNPKSVLVIGLPAIRPPFLPPLRPRDVNHVGCLLEPHVAFPVEGAPLVFATSFAHDLVLHVNRPGAGAEIPLLPDAVQGGLVVSGPGVTQLEDANRSKGSKGASDDAQGRGESLTSGTLHGYWGFDHFDGPILSIQANPGRNWQIPATAQLLAGENNTLAVVGDAVSCVERVALLGKNDNATEATAVSAPSDGRSHFLNVTFSMKAMDPGQYTLKIKQYGGSSTSTPLVAYSGAIRVGDVRVHAGDNAAVLTGQGLAAVVSVRILDQTFWPDASGNVNGTLNLRAESAVSVKLGAQAEVTLRDGRKTNVKAIMESARPKIKLVSVDAVPSPLDGNLPVQLIGKNDIPLSSTLTFVVQSVGTYPRELSIEVATVDGSERTLLSIENGALILQASKPR